MRRLADTLALARQQRFVGRSAELALFRTALAGGEPLVALHITGPGGIGKTTLLHALARLATCHGRQVVPIDSRHVEPSPSAFEAALRLQATQLGDANLAPGVILLIDTYELLTPLDAWLRDVLLPQIPADTLIVFAGRHDPSSWLADSSWGALTRAVTLANLAPAESQTYLAARGVPAERHAAALRFTHGHPLALSLLADLYAQSVPPVAADPDGSSDVLRALLDRFLQDVPTSRHRQALELAVIARTTTVSLLAGLFDDDAAFELFQWMRRLSFVEAGPFGLFPHDLVREVLDADLHWRDPLRYAELQQVALRTLERQSMGASPIERQRLRVEIMFINRRDPGMRQFFAWEVADTAYAEPARPDDFAAILAMVERHEGSASAAIARHWQRHQPEGFLVYRTPEGDRYGFMLQLALQRVTAEDAAVDPAMAAALSYLQSQRPLAPGEAASYMRFWMAAETHQAISPAVNITAANCVIHWTTTPGLIWSFVAMANPEIMAPHFESIRFALTPEADFVVGDRAYGVFGHSWELDPVEAWRAATRHAAIASPPEPPPPAAEPLTDRELAEAVRQAMRDYTRPDLLDASPLLRGPLLADGERTPEALRALLLEAVASLSANPKDARLHRALWYTYIEPELSQERAAERLGLPLNTYRYHLAKGLERMTGWLRRRADPPTT